MKPNYRQPDFWEPRLSDGSCNFGGWKYPCNAKAVYTRSWPHKRSSSGIYDLCAAHYIEVVHGAISRPLNLRDLIFS